MNLFDELKNRGNSEFQERYLNDKHIPEYFDDTACTQDQNQNLLKLFGEPDSYLEEAAKLIADREKASIGMIQRSFKIGFNRAARIMDQLECLGVVGGEEGTSPRKVLVTSDNLEQVRSTIQYLQYALHANTKKILRAPFHENNFTKESKYDFDTMDGHCFESFCANILKKQGFLNIQVTQGSGDHGIDILAEKDDITYAIQCKCYSSNIGNAAVQQAYAGKNFYHKDIAVVLTNQYFTVQAKEEAVILGVKLWDRDRLNRLLNEKT